MIQLLKKHLRATILAGNKVYCTCCNKGFITFLPFEYRHGAECPFCLSLERHRLIGLFLAKSNVFKDDGKKFLHVAPENCLSKPLKSFFKENYIPADKFTEGYTGYDKATSDLDITDIKFPDNSFDYVMCNHVLEHVDDDKKAMREIYRVLKPGGFAILQVPIEMEKKETYEDPSITDPKERERLFGQYDHVRNYGIDYFDRLKQAGFTVKVDALFSTLSYKEVFKYGLYKDEELYLCYK